PATGQRCPRSLQRRKVPEPASARETGRRLPLACARHASASADLYTYASRARNPQAAGRGQFSEGDRRNPGTQCQDGGGAQVQPDAQARHPQQSAAGNVRDPEEDHQDSRQPVASSSRKAEGAHAAPFVLTQKCFTSAVSLLELPSRQEGCAWKS